MLDYGFTGGVITVVLGFVLAYNVPAVSFLRSASYPGLCSLISNLRNRFEREND